MATNGEHSSLPARQKAVVQGSQACTFELSKDRPVLAPEPTQVLIKVSAVALNHCDWKMASQVLCPGAVVGADFSGTIVAMGQSVTSACDLKVGDRVAGAQMGNDRHHPWAGAYAEYIRLEADECWKVSSNTPDEQAAAVGCAATSTVGMALWRCLELAGTPERPIAELQWVLVYGGATASGTFAIQLLKLSGYQVVTTCSPKNFALVESYGATKAFDYHTATCGDDIRAYTGNKLKYALDIITEARTIRHCYAAIGRGGGKYCGFELLPAELMATMRKAVKADWAMGLEMTGLEVDAPGGYYRKPNPELHAWFLGFIQRFSDWLSRGIIRPHPVKVIPGGMASVIDGIYAMRRREFSAQKIVYML